MNIKAITFILLLCLIAEGTGIGERISSEQDGNEMVHDEAESSHTELFKIRMAHYLSLNRALLEGVIRLFGSLHSADNSP